MRYFLDTEFIEDGQTIKLVSIGIVAEDGREYYAISLEFNPYSASHWVVENVFSSLPTPPQGTMGGSYYLADGDRIALNDPAVPQELKDLAMQWKTPSTITNEVIRFCSPERYGTPEFWADYASYDWVVFCQLFGRRVYLPKGYPMYCNDLQQAILGKNITLPTQESGLHNALEDARWVRDCWGFLNDENRNAPLSNLLSLED